MDQTTAATACPDQNREVIEPMLPASNRIVVVTDESRRCANSETSGFPMSLMGQPKKRYRNPNDQNRLVAKSGESNISTSGGRSKGKGSAGTIFVGFFTMLVDAKWRWTLLVFFTSFYLSWMIFAFIFWFICYIHGDFDPTFLAHAVDETTNSTVGACIENIKDFTSVFLFSLEIQTTIGFGHSRVTEQCFPAILTLTIQVLLGAIIEAFLVGIVFTKLVRTKQRAQAIAFSYHAVICHQDGQLCFMFRCEDRHTSRIIGAKLRATLVRRSRITREGLTVLLEQYPMKVHPSGDDSDLLLFWPATIVHPITVESPLYGITAAQIGPQNDNNSFEIIVTLEGTTASTNMAAQALTSYLPSEILWDHKFDEMTDVSGRPIVNHSLLNSVSPVPETQLE